MLAVFVVTAVVQVLGRAASAAIFEQVVFWMLVAAPVACFALTRLGANVLVVWSAYAIPTFGGMTYDIATNSIGDEGDGLEMLGRIFVGTSVVFALVGAWLGQLLNRRQRKA